MAGAMAVVSRLRILVDMDTKDASKGASKLSRGVSKLTGPALAAGAAVTGLAVAAADSASRLQQSQGAVETVFGKSADQIEAWAKAADQSVGLSEAAYGEMASTIGAQLKNLGTPMDDVAGRTNELIEMGADLAATYGGSTADAVSALGSALRGETDPVERYGISIKQATIEAKVGKDRLKGMTDEQAKAAKTTALLELVTEQAGGAVGAFGREADTASGQQQRANAAWEDASAALGTALLPALTWVAKTLASVAGWVEKNRTATIILVSVIGAFAAAILVLNVAVNAYTLATNLAGIASKKAWLSALWPVLAVVAAIVAVGAAVIYAYKKFTWFRRAVDAVWAAVKAAASAVWKAIVGFVTGAIRVATSAVRGFSRVVSSIFRGIGSIASSVWRGVSKAASAAGRAISDAMRAVRDVVRSVFDWVLDKVRSVFDALPGPAKAAVKLITAPFDGLVRVVKKVIDLVEDLIGWLGRLKFPSPPSWMKKIPGLGSLSAGGATVAATAAPGVSGRAAVEAGTGGVTIVVQGALDPSAVAAQVRRILRDDTRRRGVVVMGRGE